MTLKKMVNGQVIDMSADEEAAVRAEWAANDAAALQADSAEVGSRNIAATSERSRTDALADIERKMTSGADQSEINQALLQLLKEQS